MTPQRACELLQIDLKSFTPPEPRTDEACKAAAEKMHKHAQRTFRRKAKSVHPDAGGSHERMVELKNALDIVLSLSLRPPRRKPNLVFYNAPFATGTTATTTGSTGFTVRFVYK